MADDSADWPQWRGPHRDGHAAAQSLLQTWPDSGPKLLWQSDDLGAGYSAVAVVGDRVYTAGTAEDQNFLICISAMDGSTLWRTELGKAAEKSQYNHGWGGGMRSTPTVDGEMVFVLTDTGTVVAAETEGGQIAWQTDLVEQFGGGIPTWGYSESVLILGDVVYCTPGGENFVVGLDRRSGEKVWQSEGVSAPAQYVSLIRGEVDGKSFLVTASKSGLVGLDLENGRQVFANEATGNRVAVIPTPIVFGNSLYHTSDYGAGNTLLDLSVAGDGWTANQVYHMTDKTMRNHHGGVVLVDGVIYGFTKANGGAWMAQDVRNGKVLWEERGRPNKSGSIAIADGRLYCYSDKDGVCQLVEPNREQFSLRGKVTLPRQTSLPRDKGAIWAHPVIAGGMLLIRDQDLLYAYDIAR